MNARVITSVAVLIALAGGMALKVGRYSGHGEAASTTAERHIAVVMSQHGWLEKNEAAVTGHLPFLQKVFVRGCCSEPVFVAILTGNAEGAEFFRLQHSGNVAFVQDDVVSHPNGFRRQIANMTRAAGRLVGHGDGQTLPVLAVSPAPPIDRDECAGPPAQAWRP